MRVILYYNENAGDTAPLVFTSVDALKKHFEDEGVTFPEDAEDEHIIKLLEAEGDHEYVGSHFWFATRRVRG